MLIKRIIFVSPSNMVLKKKLENPTLKEKTLYWDIENIKWFEIEDGACSWNDQNLVKISDAGKISLWALKNTNWVVF